MSREVRNTYCNKFPMIPSATSLSLLIAATFLAVSSSLAGDAALGSGKPVSVKQPNNARTSSLPDVCKTPSTESATPIPYPNIGNSRETTRGSKKLKFSQKPTGPRVESLKDGRKVLEKDAQIREARKDKRKAADSLERAGSLLGSGRFQKALDILGGIDVGKLDERRKGAFYKMRALARDKSGDRGGAYDDYKRLARDAPGNAEIQYLYGGAALRTGRIGEAVSALQEASYLDPLDPEKKRLYRKALEQRDKITIPPEEGENKEVESENKTISPMEDEATPLDPERKSLESGGGG